MSKRKSSRSASTKGSRGKKASKRAARSTTTGRYLKKGNKRTLSTGPRRHSKD